MPTDVDITLEPMAGLVREHLLIDERVEAAKLAAEAAMHTPDDPGLVAAALDELRTLEDFMEQALELHIAKEELVLFPALRLDAAMTVTVDELIEQHLDIRDKRAALAAALESLDAEHDEVREGRARLTESVANASARPSVTTLTELWEAVRRLHWIFQGHFGDEEDDLFAPAEALLSRATLAELEVQTQALEAERARDTRS